MRVLLLADHNSTHTKRWAEALSQRGIEVFIFSLTQAPLTWYSNLKNVEVHHLDFQADRMNTNKIGWQKLKYLSIISNISAYYKKVQPDLVHAHYASSYGLLAAWLNKHPLVVSVWGTDVYLFPRKSFIHRKLLQFNFKRADQLLSTSKDMAREAGKYTAKSFKITPFGIDLDRFKKLEVVKKQGGPITIGTIKGMEETYGIDTLIQAFALVKNRLPELSIQLILVGGGSKTQTYQKLVKSLKVEESVEFVGKVDFSQIVSQYNRIDIFAALSRAESFGVAVLEALACGVPAVVSNVGGLPEVIDPDKNGFLVEPENPEMAADALEKLVVNPNLRKIMGENARPWVEQNYNWQNNADEMVNIYKDVVKH